MGQAKQRGSYEERKQLAEQKAREAEAERKRRDREIRRPRKLVSALTALIAGAALAPTVDVTHIKRSMRDAKPGNPPSGS